MFWKIRCETVEKGEDIASEGRYVLHRHVDAEGEHLDLRLECEGCLKGWRVDALDLDGESWGSEKAPHPLRWLDDDGDAVRMDAGVYAWERVSSDGGSLLLEGPGGVRRVEVSQVESLPVRSAREIVDACRAEGVNCGDAAGLVSDGVHARQRAVERLCGLGRELDGDAFDETVWRRSLSGLSLEEVHGQLRSFEVRFDAKYPPEPVTRGDEGEQVEEGAYGRALSIVRD